MYQGKWHVLVYNIYNYNPETKTKTSRSKYSLIRLDDEDNVTIIAENMEDDLWHFYKSNKDLIIEENKIWRHKGSSYNDNPMELKSYEGVGKVWHGGWGEYWAISYEDRIESYYDYQYTENLTTLRDNPVMPNPPYTNEILMHFPKPSFFGGTRDSWQRTAGLQWGRTVFFKDHYYYFGGIRGFLEDNPSGSRPENASSYSETETTYKRLHKDKDGSVSSNWEIITPPWKPRSAGYLSSPTYGARTQSPNKEHYLGDEEVGDAPPNINYKRNGKSSGKKNLEIKLSRDGEKLFIGYGNEFGRRLENRGDGDYWYTYYQKEYTDIWSTTDGITWNSDTKDNFDDTSSYYNNAYNYYGDRPKYVTKVTPTPLEPAWAKNSKSFYYKMDTARSWAPPTPYTEIREAADRGETNFTITDEHKNAYNNFLISKTHPDKANQDDWKALKINNYTKNSMHWMSSPEYLFAFGDKIVRLLDYDQIDNYYNGNVNQSRYNDFIKNSKTWNERGNNGGYTDEFWDEEYSQEDCYFQSMYYKAHADLMSEVLHGDIKDVYPDEAIRHYVIEFFH